MLFNSLLFPVFLVVVFGVSWGLARMQALRLAFLLLASWLFYMSWHPWFIVLIAFSTLVDFFLAIKIEDTPKTDEKTRKRLLYASLISNLGLLGYFKYTKKRYGKGRRILLMAPLHHHFEQTGWKETQVVVRFWIITILLVLVGLSTLKIR